ncbi:hypothetical protein ACH5RR_006425 [Cinchona calisaya]|uniref:Uncharacterized protein n=1 Tax=Cinchona calisaya TaxID=153742 RepID=A0ABD3ANZ8_9GENT
MTEKILISPAIEALADKVVGIDTTPTVQSIANPDGKRDTNILSVQQEDTPLIDRPTNDNKEDSMISRSVLESKKIVDEDEITDSLSNSAEVVCVPKIREQLRLLYRQLLDSLNNKGLKSALHESSASPGFSAVQRT